jgi:TonB family protein
VSIRSKWIRIGLAAVAAALFAGGSLVAQQSTTDPGKRKVKTKVTPVYPDLARRMDVTGKVKIEVVIAPDGHVRSTRVIGGHPLLVQPCVDAAKEWKFYPAPEETTQVIEFDFHGQD